MAQFWDGKVKKIQYGFVEGEEKTISVSIETSTKKVKGMS